MRYNFINFVIYTTYLTILFLAIVSKPIWLDEALTYFQVSSKDWMSFISSFEYGINLMPYSYFILLWLIDKISSLTILTLRLPSLIFFIATIIYTHHLLSCRFGVYFVIGIYKC